MIKHIQTAQWRKNNLCEASGGTSQYAEFPIIANTIYNLGQKIAMQKAAASSTDKCMAKMQGLDVASQRTTPLESVMGQSMDSMSHSEAQP